MSVVGDGFRAVSQAVLYVIPVGIWYGRRGGFAVATWGWGTQALTQTMEGV